MSLLSLSHISKVYGADEVLDDISLRVERGDHLALVGANGAGKSTVLRIMAGLEEPDAGSVARARGLRLAYLEQEPDFSGSATLYEAMLEIFREVIDAQSRLRELEHEMAGGGTAAAAMDEYSRLQALVEHSGYDYRALIERVLVGLELGPDTWHVPIERLSGGQLTRANLARTLLVDADVLLLDEPTNHLDIQAVEWLESYLRDLKRAFVLVAHDRYLLDHVTRRTVEISFRQVAQYDAPYSRFLELKAERMARRRDEYDAQQRHIAKTEEFIHRYGAGQRSKEARGRQKQLDRLERIDRPDEEGAIHLDLGKPRRSGDVVLEARNLVAGYSGKPLVSLPREVMIRRGRHIAMIGPNGSGKTTLLRTLIQDLLPLEGTVRWGANTSLGYYSQTLDRLDERRTVLEEVQSAHPMSEEEARGYLGRFLFSGDDVLKTVGTLSGGEKSRVALAGLILTQPNVLVLDEPTNHLDIAARDALRDVLSSFDGTLLFVSHDRALIDHLARELWVVDAGRLRRFEGGYSDYAAGRAVAIDGPDPETAVDRKQPVPAQPLEELEDETEALAARLAEASTTVGVGQLAEMIGRYAEVQGLLEEAQEAWLREIHDRVRSSSD